MTKYNNSNDMLTGSSTGTGSGTVTVTGTSTGTSTGSSSGIKQEYANYPHQSQPVAYGYHHNTNNNNNNNSGNLSQHPNNVTNGHTPHQTLQQFFNRFNAVGTDGSIGGHSACNFSNSLSHSAGPESGKQQSLTSSSPIYTTDYDDEDSSLSSEEHVLAPLVCASAQSSRPCLTWACKACKKKSVTVDRRKAATMRERRRLRKVRRAKECQEDLLHSTCWQIKLKRDGAGI